MDELFEFRVVEKFAPLLFGPDEGVRLAPHPLGGNLVRKITLAPSDPKFEEVGKLHATLRSEQNEYLFFGWIIHRKYTKEEIEAAELFQLQFTATFEPSGEECGTLYDDSVACPHCGAGAKRTSDLWLNVSRIPKGKDIARTIADEWIVSQKMAGLIHRENISGVELKPVHHRGQTRKEGDTWYELAISSPPVSFSSRSCVGNAPFDMDPAGESRCPKGHVLGLNLLSEAYIKKSTWTGADITCTAQLTGTRRGLLRPKPLPLISPRLRKLMVKDKIKGFETEVAHLV